MTRDTGVSSTRNTRAAMRHALVLATVTTLAFAGSWPSRAQDAPPDAPVEPPRKSDPRALELLRRADAVTYRPTAAGLKSLRCAATYQMTNGMIYKIAYAMEEPGKSSIDLQTSESGERGRWDDSERERYKKLLDDLFDGPRLEESLRTSDLEVRDEDGRPLVVARRPGSSSVRELRFLPDGPLAEDGPGEASVKKGIGVRRRLTYDREGELFLRKRGVLDGYGEGTCGWVYERVGGLLLPKRYATWLSGLGGTLTISEIEVNVPMTGPAKLVAPAPPPSQDELDALDVDGLISKIRPPFVGPSPNPVTAIRTVRALGRKGDDAKRAIPYLIVLLALDKWEEPPEKTRPKDYADFRPAAAKLLARLRPESIAPLIAALKSTSSEQRKRSAFALGEMGPDAGAAVEALVSAIGDEMWFVGINASAALRKIGCPAEKALPALLRGAQPWWMGDAFAEEALAFVGADAEGDHKLVAAFVAQPLKFERGGPRAAEKPCGLELLFGKRGANAVPHLVLAAKETEDPAMREQIAVALGCAGPPAFDALRASLEAEDAGQRIAALRGVSWAARAAAPLAATIAALLASPDEGVADAAEETLGRIGAAATKDVEVFLAARPASGADAARDRATRLLEVLRAK